MGENSGIAWTHHTFNPWWGCEKVSPACTHCYAETFDARMSPTDPHWGPGSTRKFFGDKHWNEPRRWNRAAEKSGRRARVFCASMADVFEDRADLDPQRARLWHLVRETPHLDWLFLTKRPEQIGRLLGLGAHERANVWLGTTVENQHYADERLPHLLNNRATQWFVSAEPLLGPLDIVRFMSPFSSVTPHKLTWVITGNESGAGARPQNVEWFRSLRDQCEEEHVAFFLKQANEDAKLVTIGEGSWTKGPGGKLIEQPYLDGVQHIEVPT